MGKIFSNKNLIIKIATILVIVILFNFINPGISFGAVSGGIGGVLFEPIKDLVLAIGDGIVNIMQMLYLAQMYHYWNKSTVLPMFL